MKKRSDGRYAAHIFLGVKDGKRQYKTVYGTSKREVNEKAAELRAKMGRGIDITANDSFGVWADRYIAIKKTEQLSAGHINGLQVNREHLACLDDFPLSKITIGDVQDIINRLASFHDGRKPMAKRSLRGVKQTASQIFILAIKSRVVDYNPAQYVTIPKGAAESTRDALDETQQSWVTTTEHRAKRAAMIMMYAGLRRGELLALTWGDVDLDAGTIQVNKAVEYIDGLPKIKSTKTTAGVRTVNIPSVLVEYLEEQKAADSCFYVIHNKDGRMLSRSSWRRMWESYMAELNLQHGYSEEERQKNNITSVKNPNGLELRIDTFTAHQLRHTFCTLMYLAGVDILTARDQMGHRDIETTLQIYTHLDKEYKRNSMGKLNEYLCRSNAGQEKKNNTNNRVKMANE